MSLMIQGAKYAYDEDLGRFVNAAHKRVSEILMDIDPDLVILWEPERKNYALAHMPAGREPYIISTFPEDAMDHRIVEVVLNAKAAASGRPGSLADRLDRAATAKRMVQLKETEAMIEEERDKARFLWTTPLHNPRLDGKTYRL